MKTHIIKKAFKFSLLSLILSGCSDSSPRISNLLDQAHSLFSTGTLTSGEGKAAADNSYRSISLTEDKSPHDFNALKWPLSCQGDMPKCQSGRSDVGLQDASIVGEVLIVDLEAYPWLALQNKRNLRTLRIEGDKVILRSNMKLPSTQVTIVTDELVVEKEGGMDLTPVDFGAAQAAFGHDSKGVKGEAKARNGRDGLPGSSLLLAAGKITFVERNKKNVFVVRGGRGESAGQGFGKTEAEFEKDPFVSAGRTAVGDNSGAFPQYAGSIIHSGYHNSGMTEISNCRSRNSETCGSKYYPINPIKEIGHYEWPADGVDAIAGGYPGAGGEGGRVLIASSSRIPEDYFDTSRGSAGRPDVKRKGSKGATPNPAYRIVWTPGSLGHKPSLESHTQVDGKDAESPQSPMYENANGKIFLVQNKQYFLPSVPYLNLKVQKIKDTYFSRDFKKSIDLVNELNTKLKGLPLVETKYLAVISQIRLLESSLINQKDFFGRGLNDVPQYSFHFNVQEFEALLERNLRSYYLSRLFKARFEKSEERLSIIKSSLSHFENQITGGQEKLNSIFTALNNVETLSRQIQVDEKNLNEELETIRLQIEAIAKSNVAVRRAQAEFGRFIEVVAAAAKIIPVGQPALAAGASIFSTFYKGPSDQTFSSYVSYFKDLKGQVEGFDVGDNLSKSAASWQEFKDQFNISNLDGKTYEEKGRYIYELYGKVSPTLAKVGEEMSKLNQPVFPDEEIQKEIEKIQTTDPTFSPIFQGIKGKLNSLLALKMKFQSERLKISDDIASVTEEITNYVTISSRLSGDVLSATWVDDGELMRTFERISSDSEMKLLQLYSNIRQTYEYTTLEKNSFQDLNLMKLRREVDSYLQAQNQAQAVTDLKAFYMSAVDSLKERLADKINKNDEVTNSNVGFVNRELKPLELAALNRNGFVDLELRSEDYQHQENVRITSIAPEESYTVIETDRDSKFSFALLKISLDTKGSLIFRKKKYDFIYPEALSNRAYSWKYRFNLGGEGEGYKMTTDVSSPYLTSILRSLHNIRSDRDLDTMYTTHAGITKVRIQYLSKEPGRNKLRSLVVRIDYLYSDTAW